MARTKQPLAERIPYDPDRHCGQMLSRRGKTVRCKALKGQNTSHPGEGRCSEHTDHSASNYYLSVRPTRLHYLIERVKQEKNPIDVTKELEVMRALAIAFIEDNSELTDPNGILQASELLSKIAKVAQQCQQIQQAEMIHIKAVELIHMQMAEVVMRVIQGSGIGDDMADKLIEQIKNRWGTIKIETNPKELQKVLAAQNQTNEEVQNG